jgi:flagellar biosynthesis protein FlhF
MIVKSFTAESASAALKLVREQMGGEAIVLKTVQRTDSSDEEQVEITACLERPSVAQTDVLLAVETKPQRVAPEVLATEAGTDRVGGRLAAMEQKLDQLVADGPHASTIETSPHADDLAWLTERFQAADLPLEFAGSLIKQVKRTLETVGDFRHVVDRALYQSLDRLVAPGLNIVPGSRVAFVGPAGMGKSSVMGKLAARLVIEDQLTVRLANLNTAKPAAHEEVARYAEALEAEFLENITSGVKPTEDDQAITLFDCAALPSDTDRREAMISQLELVAPTHCIAVLSSLTRTSDILRLADNLAELKPTHLAITMLDQSSCFGPAIAAAQQMTTPIALGTDASAGFGELRELDARMLTNAILNHEEDDA